MEWLNYHHLLYFWMVAKTGSIARELSPTVHIMARCHFISNGMEAHKRGANEVVIEEQVIAQELVRLLKKGVVPELQVAG